MNVKVTAEVRSKALELLAEWMAKHDDECTKQDFLEDLQLYSPSQFDEHHERHDHHEFVFHPSIGDEAGYWTLYVIVASGGGFGLVDAEMAKAINTDVIRSIAQVFDTTYSLVYTLEDVWDEGKGHTITMPRWHNCPEEGA